MDFINKTDYCQRISDIVSDTIEELSGYVFDGKIKVRIYDDGGIVCQIRTNNLLPLFEFMLDACPEDLNVAIKAILKASDFWRMSRYEVRLVNDGREKIK